MLANRKKIALMPLDIDLVNNFARGMHITSAHSLITLEGHLSGPQWRLICLDRP